MLNVNETVTYALFPAKTERHYPVGMVTLSHEYTVTIISGYRHHV